MATFSKVFGKPTSITASSGSILFSIIHFFLTCCHLAPLTQMQVTLWLPCDLNTITNFFHKCIWNCENVIMIKKNNNKEQLSLILFLPVIFSSNCILISWLCRSIVVTVHRENGELPNHGQKRRCPPAVSSARRPSTRPGGCRATRSTLPVWNTEWLLLREQSYRWISRLEPQEPRKNGLNALLWWLHKPAPSVM